MHYKKYFGIIVFLSKKYCFSLRLYSNGYMLINDPSNNVQKLSVIMTPECSPKYLMQLCSFAIYILGNREYYRLHKQNMWKIRKSICVRLVGRACVRVYTLLGIVNLSTALYKLIKWRHFRLKPMDQSTMLTFILCKKAKTELINMTDAYFKKKKNMHV